MPNVFKKRVYYRDFVLLGGIFWQYFLDIGKLSNCLAIIWPIYQIFFCEKVILLNTLVYKKVVSFHLWFKLHCLHLSVYCTVNTIHCTVLSIQCVVNSLQRVINVHIRKLILLFNFTSSITMETQQSLQMICDNRLLQVYSTICLSL